MIPVLDAQAIRKADAYTIAHDPIRSIDLMERAATRCVGRILYWHGQGRFGDPSAVVYHVVSGMGNNGGDGLAIARLLHLNGLKVRVTRLAHRGSASPDNSENWERASSSGIRMDSLSGNEHELTIGGNEIVIDALVGTGLNAPFSGWIIDVIGMINRSERPVISIDMPSGLFAEDNRSNDTDAIIKADLTLALEVPKLAFFLAENDRFVGDVEIVPIGLDAGFIAGLTTDHFLTETLDVIRLLRPRARFAHKGNFGHALIIAGGKGKMGAAVLASKAATRSGAGLVTSHVSINGAAVLQATVPESMCSVDQGVDRIEDLPSIEPFSAVGIGPGIGTDDATQMVLKRLIQAGSQALVIDADALNILAENPTWQAFLPPGTILTPHPKEFDRFAGSPSGSGFERLERASAMAQRLACVIVLKGAWTAVCDPQGRVHFNPTGNPGMAKGGSGDALTGLLTGLRAQGYGPLEASVLGVYLHGAAGDIAAAELGMDGMTVGDVIDAIPAAWVQLRAASEKSV